ncbi:MAG: hypothetical protein QM706_14940 [Nitrospira sp.]
MVDWKRQTKCLIAVLAAVSFFSIASIDQAAGYLSKTATAFSEDGRLLLIQTDELVVWDLETKALVAKVPDLHCQQIALMKQDGWVLCVEQSVTIYDWKNRVSVATIPPESQRAYELLAYSRESDRMILRHGNEAVSVWQLGKKPVPLRHIVLGIKKEAPSVAASSDARLLAIAQGHTIHLHDLTGTSVRNLVVEGGTPRDLLFAPDSSRLAASVGDTIILVNPMDGSISLRATLTSAERAQGSLTPEAFSRDGHRLVAANGEWSYALFNTDTGALVALTKFTYTAPGRGMRSPTQLRAVDIAADADHVVGQPEHLHTLQIWDLQTGEMVSDLCGEDCRTVGLRVSLLRWSPTGSKIVIGMHGGLDPEVDGKISVWDVPSRSPELVLDPGQPQAKVLAKRAAPPVSVTLTPSATRAAPAFVHALALRAVVTSPRANLLVTSGDDRLLKIWDPGQGTLLRQLVLAAPATALVFSADGAILAAGTMQGTIRLWDTQTWREFLPYSSGQGRINAMQFLPGNRLLVVAGARPKVPVVDLVNRTVVKELTHISSPACDEKSCAKKRAAQGEIVDSLNFLDGSSFLLTTSQSGRVVWDLTTWREVLKPAGLPDVWSGLGWRHPFVWMTTHSRDPNVLTLAVWDTKRNGVFASLDTFTNRDTEIDHGPPVSLGTSMAVDPSHRWAATRIGAHYGKQNP